MSISSGAQRINALQFSVAITDIWRNTFVYDDIICIYVVLIAINVWLMEYGTL